MVAGRFQAGVGRDSVRKRAATARPTSSAATAAPFSLRGKVAGLGHKQPSRATQWTGAAGSTQ